jgi:hypothetical protein
MSREGRTAIAPVTSPTWIIDAVIAGDELVGLVDVRHGY